MQDAKEPRWRRRPKERPSDLAAAALRLFCKQGYFVTTIDDIAREAGATKGAVYHHYESKEELFEAAITLYFQTSFAKAEAEMNRFPSSDALGRIEALLRAGASVWTSDEFPAVLCLVLGEPGQTVPSVRQTFMRSGPIRGWRLLVSLLERGKHIGALRPDLDSRTVARLINSGLAFSSALLSSGGLSRPGRQRNFELALASVLALIRA